MIIKRSTLPENYAWTFGSSYSDITDEGSFICSCWVTEPRCCCLSDCFADIGNYYSGIFNIGNVYGIFCEGHI